MIDEQDRADVDCSCGKHLQHDRRYCPLFPEVLPPLHWSAAYRHEKWSRCVCLIHTHPYYSPEDFELGDDVTDQATG